MTSIRPYAIGTAMTLVAVTALVLMGLREQKWGTVPVAPSLEDVLADGSLYNPSTQSFLRGHHWLESVQAVELSTDDHTGTILFHASQPQHSLRIVNLPLDYLVPRLHYRPAATPDAFDAFNLMMAEFSRNSLSVPVGVAGDEMAHFETDLVEAAPWTLAGDYSFTPQPSVRPNRVSVINNCLRAGLWELNATDRSGEIYHAWFSMPEPLYYRLLAEVNGVGEDFARQATNWNTETVPLDLSRLRTEAGDKMQTPVALVPNAEAGYSSQDSRRKLSKGYVLVQKGESLEKPTHLYDLTTAPVHMSSFIEPGKYSSTERRAFDLSFLARVAEAAVRPVVPLTSYNMAGLAEERQPPSEKHLEITLQLDEAALVLGNLPMSLLVPQEDYEMNGFGVGILHSSGFAERQKYLIEEGPAPSYAYLYREVNGQQMAINSHDFGLEQIFIRTHIQDEKPWWEITITSYERIVDLVKYRVDIPQEYWDELRQYHLEYIAPLYRTYRDDNLR